uniref:Transposase Tc1-like domain-containing protein n=1 Tax=Nothobranchius furzeri TaxID=105023 RepID=A0A8C6NP98_NOTFU
SLEQTPSNNVRKMEAQPSYRDVQDVHGSCRRERRLTRRVEENRRASSPQLAKAVEVSRETTRRTLQRNGMHGYHPRRRPLLKPTHNKAHLGFARDKDHHHVCLLI